MNFYKELDFINLDEIQKEDLKLIPDSNTKNLMGLFYFAGVPEYLKIDKLRQYLEIVNELNNVLFIGTLFTAPNVKGNLHRDDGPHIFSLNIPLLNCHNTFIEFFKTNSIPQKTKFKNSDQGTYSKFDPEECQLIFRKEVQNPYIINTLVPHRVVNENNKTRIMLCIRLSRSNNLKIRS